jgi:hypothetical protein
VSWKPLGNRWHICWQGFARSEPLACVGMKTPLARALVRSIKHVPVSYRYRCPPWDGGLTTQGVGGGRLLCERTAECRWTFWLPAADAERANLATKATRAICCQSRPFESRVIHTLTGGRDADNNRRPERRGRFGSTPHRLTPAGLGRCWLRPEGRVR